MLTRGIVALVVAMAVSSVAAAADLPQATAGLVDGIEGAGEAPLDLADRPGFKLSHSFRLRLDMSDRINAVTHGATPTRTVLLDKSRSRRFGSAVDFYPMTDSGFHLSAGMRKLPHAARRGISGGASGVTAFDLAGLGSVTALGQSGLSRKSPTLTAGWTGMVAKEMQLGFSAGAAQEHGKSFSTDGGLASGGATKHWSRIGQVASVNLAMRF